MSITNFLFLLLAFNYSALASNISLIEQKAEAGDAFALFELGYMYDEGEGVPEDNEKALKYYHLAAEKNQVNALYNIGIIHRKGDGVEDNYTKDFDYIKKSADLGHSDACRYV